MTFRRSAPAALITASALVILVLTLVSHWLFSGLTDSIEQGQYQLMQSIVTSALNTTAEDALARADIVANLDATREAVAAKDRDKLLALYAEMYKVQHDRHGVGQSQFHVPPSVSLLRLHSPAAFGDDLTRSRPMVTAVNRDHQPRKGFTIARGGPAIFGVAPIHDKTGTHVGSFEFGIDFGPLLDQLKAVYGLDLTLYVEEKPLHDFAKGVDPSIYSDQNRLSHFIRFHSTDARLTADLVKDADISGVAQPVRYSRDSDGVPYGVLLVPLRNAAGESLGVLVVMRDFSASRAAAAQSFVWQIAAAVFGIVLLAGAIIIVIRGFLLRPLGIVTSRLKSENGVDEVPADTDKFCQEIRDLAELHDRLKPGRGA
ncbi:MAG TPA: cache domain-containing protein [Rhizomicrobium sp.]